VLDQCCCGKNIATCLWILFMNFPRWHEEGAIIYLKKTINLRYSGLERWRHAVIFKSAEDWSSGKNSLKTAKNCILVAKKSFSCYASFSKSWQNNPPACKEFLCKAKFCDFSFSEITRFCVILSLSYHICIRCNTSPSYIIHIKISFHVWN